IEETLVKKLDSLLFNLDSILVDNLFSFIICLDEEKYLTVGCNLPLISQNKLAVLQKTLFDFKFC
ncbi:hypothetical protein PYV02_15335, partial [Leifsonia sp. H3M29-4]|uniref:hypothetical protein n=1 Tax=Salinibacterium metalliresistens TaxID=3031321 RepID=UPI0023DBA1A7